MPLMRPALLVIGAACIALLMIIEYLAETIIKTKRYRTGVIKITNGRCSSIGIQRAYQMVGLEDVVSA